MDNKDNKKKQFPKNGRIVNVQGKTMIEHYRSKTNEELKAESLKGDPGAIGERLRRSGL